LITSPCVNICRLDARNRCEGCSRTLAEIASWSKLSDAERERIMAELPVRGMLPPAAAEPDGGRR